MPHGATGFVPVHLIEVNEVLLGKVVGGLYSMIKSTEQLGVFSNEGQAQEGAIVRLFRLATPKTSHNEQYQLNRYLIHRNSNIDLFDSACGGEL